MLEWIILILFVGVVGIIFYGIFLLVRQKILAFFDQKRAIDFCFLQISIPKKESKEDVDRERDQTSDMHKVVAIAEHFFSSIYGIYNGEWQNYFTGEDHISLEYIATEGQTKFVIGCPRDLKDLLDKQITSFYPEAIIDELEKIDFFKENTHQATGYLTGSKEYAFPFKNYHQFETTDPINNILNALAGSSDDQGNSAAIQFLIKPVVNDWQQDVRDQAKELDSGKKKKSWWNLLGHVGDFVSLMMSGANEKSDEESGKEQNESQDLTKSMEDKAEKVGFETIVRVVTSAENQRLAQGNLSNLMNVFIQYGSPSMNNFTSKKRYSRRVFIENFLMRRFQRSWLPENKLILSSEEVASLFHFPHVKYNNIPSVKWQNFKVVQAPANVMTERKEQKEAVLIGHNSYRGNKTPIYVKREDRFRHFYVIGQTGTGKSSIMQTMIRQDMQNGDGICVVDPHGSLVEDLLPHVPKDRIDDVIIFDPADVERPMGLNLLEAKTEDEMDMVAMESMQIMIKIFDEEIFGPRIQDYFRNGVLTLMADPEGGALTDIMRLFTDDAFQRSKIKHVTNPVVKGFWTNQMAKTGAREKQEIIPYFAAKFGQFITNGMIRNIIGQTQSSFDFAEVMAGQKLLFMNLSKGLTGELNSKLLGLIITSKIQAAAMQRQKMDKDQRKDFFLYIDEFQNYVSESIESILSEARKYRLGLCMAHQYISQIDQSGKKGGANLKDAVFGNCGTIMSYKIGAQDAEFMAKEFAPNFSEQDLVNIDAFKSVIKLAVDGQPSKPFSLDVPKPWLVKGDPNLGKGLKQISRLTYGRSRKFVEKEIFTRLDVSG